ncbi:hypothetical protein Hanom_Chr14g01283241 [Helianthus anomalus]
MSVTCYLSNPPKGCKIKRCQFRKKIFVNREVLLFGVFSEIPEEVPAQINATVDDEHDVEIIEAPARMIEPVENVDLTGIESEEDEVDDRTVDDTEVNENVDEGETETEVNTESLTAEAQIIEEPVSVSQPHVEPVAITIADAEVTEEDPTADLPPRKRSKSDQRIGGEDNTEVRTTTESTMPVITTRPSIHYKPSELSPPIIDFLSNERALMYIPVPKPGEGSSSGPSDADVVRAEALLQAAAREVEAAAKSR